MNLFFRRVILIPDKTTQKNIFRKTNVPITRQLVVIFRLTLDIGPIFIHSYD